MGRPERLDRSKVTWLTVAVNGRRSCPVARVRYLARARARWAPAASARRQPPAGARARSRTARDCTLTAATFVRRRSRRKRRDDDNDRETPCRGGGRRVRGAKGPPRAGRRGRRRHRGGPDQPPPVPAAAVPGGGGILPPGLIAPALRGIIKRERNARALLAEVQDRPLGVLAPRKHVPRHGRGRAVRGRRGRS